MAGATGASSPGAVGRRGTGEGGERAARRGQRLANDGRPYPAARSSLSMWHFLYFLPDPHGHGSFGPTLG